MYKLFFHKILIFRCLNLQNPLFKCLNPTQYYIICVGQNGAQDLSFQIHKVKEEWPILRI